MMNRTRHIILMFLMLLSWGGGAHATSLSPNPSRECAICHFNWIEVFYRKGTGTDLVDYPKEKMVATEMMCYSCHDGSIADSRFKVWETGRHKPGTKPSEKVEVPPSFPLDKDGRIQCFTCHSAHGVDTRPGMEATIFLRASNKDSAMCKMCHRDKDRGPKKGSHPVDVVFKVPDEIINAGGKAGSKGQIICQTCHEPHGSTGDHFLVIPNSGEGLTHSALCEACHTKTPDIREKSPMRLNSHPMDIIIIKEAKLPERWENGEKPYLGFDNRINCRTCHSPHNGTNENHLLVERNEKGRICLFCHPSKEVVAKSKHNMEISAPDAKNMDNLTVSEKGVCSACHFMHKGTGPKMWARPLGEGEETIEKLCVSCHSVYGIAGKKTVGKESHPIGVDINALNVETDLPLYDKYGGKSGKGNEGMVVCATCHNVHQWDPNDPMKVSNKGDEGNGSNSFLRKRFDVNNELCASCHEDKFTVQNTKHDISITGADSKNINGMPPSQSGVCGSCHQPHNGSSIRMWGRKEQGFENDPVANLCIGCHRRGSLAEKKQIGKMSHPIGVSLLNVAIKPDDKDGWKSMYLNVLKGGVLSLPELKRLPLFDKDGKRVRDGNVSCPTCHDPHRWSPNEPAKPVKKEAKKIDAASKKRIIDETGDGTNSFLRISNGPNSELCINCHIVKRPVLFTKHNLKHSSPEEKNIMGDNISKTGACGACHIPHNGVGPRLWAKKLGNNPDALQSLCESCHTERGVAAKKTVGKNSHPLGVNIKPVMKGTVLPLYDAGGKLDKENGRVVCSTCHDPHQWDPNDVSSVSGLGKGVDGDATNSFLRMGAAPDSQLCGSCHQDKKWVINTEHDMRITAPNAKNFKNQLLEQSGVCGQCHYVHNAPNGKLMWARELGPGQDMMEKMCRSCHSNNQVAAVKQPEKITHPKDVVIISSEKIKQKEAEKGSYFPLYTPVGDKVEEGGITCPTCHNPHQWKPGTEDFGPGKNIEGNATNSFLRNKSESALCTHCHGMDALFRYKFFHTEKSRVKYPLSGKP